MQYAILFYESKAALADRVGPQAAAYWSTWAAYFGALGERTASGACLTGPASGAVVRVSGSERTVQDGPHGDTKEELGGFAVIKADSLEGALAWAQRCPAATGGAVEVRPVQSMNEIPEMQS